jgi:hypothetical protein
MNWDAIGAVGELISAIAVVMTLIYVAMQLRQNTDALRSSTWQSIQDAEQRYDTLLTGDPDLIALFLRGSTQGRSELTDPESAFRYDLIAKQLIDLFHTHHYQHEIGMITDDWWQTWVKQYEDAIGSWPGFREAFKQRYPFFRPSFQRFVDEHFDLADV